MIKKKIQFKSCGCVFPTMDGRIDYDINTANMNLECQETWNLIGSGNTKGCFQLESRLGQMMSKKLKPENIEQLAALISIMRPGCLEAYREGKSVSDHYIDKKNGSESVDYFHPSLEPVLKSTYGEMIYQEQSMEIARVIAGFNLEDADVLRKAIGKKKVDLMTQVKRSFLLGAEKSNIVSNEIAEEIFGWIEKSQRYSFNKSHAISYALNAYLSAYSKCHFPSYFFASYLKFAPDKIDPMKEIYELINNCREMHIDVHKPDFKKISSTFSIDNGKDIFFGLTNIKGVGNSVYNKLEVLVENIDIDNMSYLEIILNILININQTASKAMISVGCFDYLGVGRKEMLFHFGLLNDLTKKEKGILLANINDLKKVGDCLDFLGDKVNIRRKQKILALHSTLKHPPYKLEDSCSWIADQENQLLGISITCSKIDEYSLENVNTTCREINQEKCLYRSMILGVEIKDVNIIKTKRGANPGQEMCFAKVSDNTGSTDIVVFPDKYLQYKNIITSDNTAIVSLEKSKNGSMVLSKIWQL
jgi:DNA polymerase-3 subunit alpha